MVRTAFIIKDINSWTGGFNYYKSLLSAVCKLADREIEPVVFTAGSQADEIKTKLGLDIEYHGLSCLEPKSVLSYLGRAMKKTFDRNLVFEKSLIKYKISVISHASNADAGPGIIKIGWIPDFQHVHLPEMFDNGLLAYRNKTYMELAEKSDAVILSSLDALADFKKFAPAYAAKGRVLNFAQNAAVKSFDPHRYAEIKSKYNLPDKYFYIPNQFWKHKNHITVLEALKILKNSGKPVPVVVLSGLLKDYRNAGYIGEIQNYINSAGLNDHVMLLGLIDYEEVFYLMRYSAAVINPSLFEGWSSSVEECKAIDKDIILSNIGVHVEQAPPKGKYFNPSDAGELAGILPGYWLEPPFYDDGALAEKLRLHEARRVDFARKYQEIVLSLAGKKNKTASGGCV
ncbi:MAG: Glycosyl transferases group 1 [bacterium ADurb.Bin243]|nr:MAG: Glycosyl transferases group 1 [bacterium ADurb.Bin243]